MNFDLKVQVSNLQEELSTIQRDKAQSSVQQLRDMLLAKDHQIIRQETSSHAQGERLVALQTEIGRLRQEHEDELERVQNEARIKEHHLTQQVKVIGCIGEGFTASVPHVFTPSSPFPQIPHTHGGILVVAGC